MASALFTDLSSTVKRGTFVTRAVAAGTMIVLAVLLAFPATSGALPPPAFCDDATLRADRLPARFSLKGCNVVGKTVRAGGIEVEVPPPGNGRHVHALTTGPEQELSIRTTADGFVEIEADDETTADSRTVQSATTTAPANDTIASATSLPAATSPPYGAWSAQGSTIAATRETADTTADEQCDVSAATQPLHTVWFSFTAPQMEPLNISASNADGSVALAVDVFTYYPDDGDAAGLYSSACNAQPLYAWAEQTYYVRVGSRTGTNFTVRAQPSSAPPNDDFAAARTAQISTDAWGNFDNWNMFGATLQGGEQAPACKAAGTSGTVWHRVDPGTLRRLDINAADGAVAVYRGSSLTGLGTPIACFAQAWGRHVTLPATGRYYIQHWVPAGTERAQLTVASDEPVPSSKNPCDEASYDLMGVGPRKPLRWRYNGAKAPASVKDTAVNTIKAGLAVITASKNDCGYADHVGATVEHLGSTTKTATLCTKSVRDTVNTIDFGPAQGYGQLGLACSSERVNSSGVWKITETDIRLTAGVSWTRYPDSPTCSNKYDLLSVVAHEGGHAFGLDHPYSVGNQTMAAYSVSCNGGFRTLGRGDVKALRILY